MAEIAPVNVGPWILPEGWEWQTLHSICEVRVINQSDPAEDTEYWGEKSDPLWVDIDDLAEEFITNPRRHLSEEGVKKYERNRVPNNSILLALRKQRKMAMTQTELYVSKNIAIITVRPEKALPLFVFYALQAIPQGSAASKIQIENTSIPVPFPDKPDTSKAEQEHVVNVVDTLMVDLRAGRKLLHQMQRDAEQVMDAISHQIFEDLKKNASIPNRTLKDVIPESNHRLGIEVKNYMYTEKSAESFPVLKSQNVRLRKLSTNEIQYLDLKYLDLKKKHKGAMLQPDDVLLAVSGATTGNACCVPAEHLLAVATNHLAIFRPPSEKLHHRFLMYWLTSPLIRETIRQRPSQLGAPYTSKDAIRMLPIPLPDRESQKHIVDHLDFVQSEVDTIRTTLAQDKEGLEKLERSILQQAYQKDASHDTAS